MMGKYANLEIIPLDDNEAPPVNNNEQGAFRYPDEELQPEVATMPFVGDSTIIPRVQKYLESNVDKTYIDINVMADDLQRIYKDYARRKRIPFRSSVKKAYSIVMRSYGQGTNVTSSEDVSEESANEEPPMDDPLNNQFIDMYNRPRKPLEENELIDISSDDSDDENTSHQVAEKTANGASTSQKFKDPLLPSITICKKPPLKPPVEEENAAAPKLNKERGKKRKNENQPIPVLESLPKKKKRTVAAVQESKVTFKNVGGMDSVLEQITDLLMCIRHPEVFNKFGTTPPRGILLHGPPGCGKTLLADAMAGELGIPLLKVTGPELVTGVSGESEERIRDLFDQAIASAPCMVFIDEIDAIASSRQTAQKDMERRIVAQLLGCFDDLSKNENGDKVVVVGATNRPDGLDLALRRADRFDKEISLGIPNVHARLQILKVLTSNFNLAEGFDFETIAKHTPGFVGADLKSLIREAIMAAAKRVFNTLKESWKLEKAMALQKATQELLQKQNAATQIKHEVITEVPQATDSIANAVTSSEPTEIEVVDQPNINDGAIVVIDDDVKVDRVEPEPKHMQDYNEQAAVKLQEALQLLQPSQTKQEALHSWLHSQTTFSEEQLSDVYIVMDDFAAALKMVQPSAKREGFATVPDVTWDDIGSLQDIREELQMAILAPVRHAERCEALGLTVPTGVLLCGPPGCGKTLLAKAIANEAGINFISVKGPELLNMYVGESEKAIRLCFQRARNSAPCVIFFDELDALCPKRADSGEGGVTMRVVNQMLTEMDGIEGRSGVYLLAATNRPEIVDPAVLRPGRLGKIIYVGLPSLEDRVEILRTITKNGTKPQMASDVNLELVAVQCENYTGADLAELVREASIAAFKEDLLRETPQQPLLVTAEHFKRAVAKSRPSVTEKDQKHYEKLKKIYSVQPSADGDVEEMEYS